MPKLTGKMINHQYKFIFIHIPKCAGTSINTFFSNKERILWNQPNYEELLGWCPERKFFMQHATAKQLLETGLITQEQWDTYYKFTFVRNPWDRAVSDYHWLMRDRKTRGSFKDYLLKRRAFKKYLTEVGAKHYRGDHLHPQTTFFDLEGRYKPDFIGRFETFETDMNIVLKQLGVDKRFDVHANKASKNRKHYSLSYTNSYKTLVEVMFKGDIEAFGYAFEDKRTGLYALKKHI